MGRLIFITGGIRSGKSAFAEKLTSELGQFVTYIATAQSLDEEMKHRIEIHRSRRPDNWVTVEEPFEVAGALREYGPRCDAIMVDCLTVLVSNHMFAQEQNTGRNLLEEYEKGINRSFQKEFQSAILQRISCLVKAAKEIPAHVVIVSNEVGLTLVSDNYLGRQYQEIVGLANQIVAGAADEAYLVVAGYPVDLKNGRGKR